jgi:hypothetical protein
MITAPAAPSGFVRANFSVASTVLTRGARVAEAVV